ncbi:MAG: coproporphyrinogen III oxidase [Alphaproteobacteria bacterium]|nr:coproporphyrinogen III oxidase [Alphaproteobacteria bacterium SS10]
MVRQNVQDKPVSSDSETKATPGFGIYVHWPFCAKKCPYCDFNSHVREAVDHDRWRRALITELQHFARLTPGQTVTSIFFGGGTPSLMAPQTTAAVIDTIAELWPMAEGAEITLEANPTSVEAGKFEGFGAAGVNRVSLGVQALNDTDLQFLGRQHSAAEALNAVALAKRYFARVSFDLIYARPEQSVGSWETELTQALEVGCDHLSAYQLTIEPGTQFFTLHNRGVFQIPEDELAGDLFEATQAITSAADMPAYEISNHAAPGEESRHNLTYWRYGDYVGVGPGAHGRLSLADGSRVGTRTHLAPEAWLEQVEDAGHGAKPFEVVAPIDQVTEALMMGLRLVEGLPILRIEELGGGDIDQLLDVSEVQRLTQAGLIDAQAWDKQRLSLTAAGRQRLNSVLSTLLP